LQEGGRVFGEDAGSHFDLVIQLGAGEQLEAGTEGAAFEVIGGIDEAGNPRLNDRTGAHGAGLEGNVEDAAGEAVVAEEAGGFPNDDDFGVGGGVIIANGAIAGTREDDIVVDEHGANGDLTGVRRGAGFVKSKLQIVEIVRHGMNEEKSLTQSRVRALTCSGRVAELRERWEFRCGRCWKGGSIVQVEGETMDDFPEFMKCSANKIATSSQSTPGVEGYIFDGVDGTQMAFWTCHQTAISAPHVHEYDEYMTVVQGCYTLTVGGRRIPIKAGEEYFIPKGVSHGGEVVAGTRTIHAFGGRRAERAHP
jgi:quercetin dioxygenase-like cupin family protein